MERIRCMLLDSILDYRFWAEAANTACYLINGVPCHDKNKTPEEIWSGRLPNLKFLKVFGCPALLHIPKEKRNKLEGKSIECFMMGYSTESKAYRLFNPENYGILISRVFSGKQNQPKEEN